MTPEGRAWMETYHGEEAERRKGLSVEDRMFEDAAEFAKRDPIVDELMSADPKLDIISAMVIAGDKLTVERSKQWTLEGCPAVDALPYVGSYGRLEFAMWAVDEGHFPVEVLLDQLPDLWRGSDPDDTDPRYLALWKLARVRNGGRMVRDGARLPKGSMIRCFRGQDADAPLGIAWSLNREVAEKFARGAGSRQQNRGGTVFETVVSRKEILAYLTSRGESEVILPTIGEDYRKAI